METKLPSIPKSLEAEQAFLGSLIMDSSAWDQISHLIKAKDFFDSNNNGTLFCGLLSVFEIVLSTVGIV